MGKEKSWGIIGGGFLGMTMALRLAQIGHKVTIFESAPKSGGLASSWEMNGVIWDRFYHVILLSDLNTRKIITEIGLGNDFKWVETKTGFFAGGKLYSMSNIIEFLKFPPINLLDKFRLGLTIFVASKIKNWQRLEKIRVSDWLIRWSGKRVFEKIWLPLLKAKLGDNYKNTSAAFIWTTIQRMYAARKTGLKKEMFGYVKGGYDRVNEHFTDHLQRLGVKFHFGSNVESVKLTATNRLMLETSDKNSSTFDCVISTVSSKISVQIAQGLEKSEILQHQGIQYLGVICPSVLLKKAVSPYYVTNITDTWPPFTGIIEMTALIDKEEVNGKHLIYLPKYVNPDDPLFNETDESLKRIFWESLKKMHPHLSDDDLLFWGVSKARVVLALPTLGYSQNLPGIKTSLPNYYIVNSAQIINGTLNINETIQVAESKLKEILNEQ